MPVAPDHYAEGPEALVVSLALRGDRTAFSELVRRRQSWIRNLMRRCCGDATLAEDLSQQVFVQAWRKMRQLKDPARFGGWIKRLAVNVWLQHQRKADPLAKADEIEQARGLRGDATAVEMDLDRALARLPSSARTCIILSYYVRMTHPEIAEATGLKPGTVKSHIRRGAERLRELLSAYAESDGDAERAV